MSRSQSMPMQPSQQPFLEHLRARLLSADNGKATLEVVIRRYHLRHGGTVHGGVYATIMDVVTAYAVSSFMPAGHDMVTIQLCLNMTGTAKVGDRLIATGEARHAGRRTAVSIGEIRRADGRLLATGSATLMFVPPARPVAARPRRKESRRRPPSPS